MADEKMEPAKEPAKPVVVKKPDVAPAVKKTEPAPVKPKLHVRMTRNPEQYPVPPHTADVHLDEVENWAKHGWKRVAD